MEWAMISMHGILLLQERIRMNMFTVAPLSTSRSQHSGDSLVAVSVQQNNYIQDTEHGQGSCMISKVTFKTF